MSHLWIFVLVLLALFLLFRVRARRPRRESRTPQPGLRIFGYQVNAYLHPRMGRGCLFDNGLQFGRGFRRKEGPRLPHDEHCRCEIVPFSFSSSEVFNGALRQVARIEGTIEGLPLQWARELIERLKALEGRPLPPDEAAYIAAVGPEDFPEPFREPVRAFLRERYAFVSGAAGGDTASDPVSGDTAEAPAAAAEPEGAAGGEQPGKVT